MNLEYVPLLRVQRELYDIPGRRDRFRQYLGTIFNADRTVAERPPLLAMNPMAKAHVTALLDSLLAMDADAIAAAAVAEASAELADDPGDFKVTLVVSDDLMGGWTNRYAEEFKLRFESGPPAPPDFRLPRWANAFWITGLLWSSEPAAERAVREAVRTAVYRAAYVRQHGPARTLRDRLTQEGRVLAQAGCLGPPSTRTTSPTRARCWRRTSTWTTCGRPSSVCSATRPAARWGFRRAASARGPAWRWRCTTPG